MASCEIRVGAVHFYIKVRSGGSWTYISVNCYFDELFLSKIDAVPSRLSLYTRVDFSLLFGACNVMSWDSQAFRHWMCNRIVFGNPIFLNCIDRSLIPVSSKVPDSSKDMAIDLTWRAFFANSPKESFKRMTGWKVQKSNFGIRFNMRNRRS